MCGFWATGRLLYKQPCYSSSRLKLCFIQTISEWCLIAFCLPAYLLFCIRWPCYQCSFAWRTSKRGSEVIGAFLSCSQHWFPNQRTSALHFVNFSTLKSLWLRKAFLEPAWLVYAQITAASRPGPPNAQVLELLCTSEQFHWPSGNIWVAKCLQDPHPKSEVRLKSIGEKGSERRKDMIKIH